MHGQEDYPNYYSRRDILSFLWWSAAEQGLKSIPFPAEKSPYFTLENVDFFFEEIAPPSKKEEIRNLFSSAYLILENLFGSKTLPQKVQIVFEECPYDKFCAGLNKYSCITTKEKGRVTLYLPVENNKSTNIHELAHLFTERYLFDCPSDIFREGLVVAAQLITGERLGILTRKDYLRNNLAQSASEYFFNQELYTTNYSQNPPLMLLRYTASGFAWLDAYEQDPKFFQKFFKTVGQNNLGNTPAVLENQVRQSFEGNFDLIKQKHPILEPNFQPGKKVIYSPKSLWNIILLTGCCFNLNASNRETILPRTPINTKVEVKDENQNRIVFSEQTIPTNDCGTFFLLLSTTANLSPKNFWTVKITSDYQDNQPSKEIVFPSPPVLSLQILS